MGRPSPLAAWRWAALLGFALFAPAALPAGGGDRRQPELRRRQTREPWLATRAQALRCAPERRAPVLLQLAAGEPLRVLRHWRDHQGQAWVQVELQAAELQTAVRRGWMAG